MATKTQSTQRIEIHPLQLERVTINIVGDTPLIVHAWSEKAKREMLEKQTKTTKTTAKEIRDPFKEYCHSMYWMSGTIKDTPEEYEEAIADGAKFGFPANSIKMSAISAAYRVGAVKDKVSMKGSFFIQGIQVGEQQLVEIESGPPVMREDMVTIGMGTADLRYRAEFRNWKMKLPITYNRAGPYTLEMIINAINLGGFTCGIGEWRPERDGTYGMFHVEN